MNEPWRVTLLGGLRAEQNDHVILRFYTYKIGALFAFLAYYRQQAHSRDALIEMFWPDSDMKAGRASLSTALSSLRNQFEPPGTPAHAVLRADRFSIGLNPNVVITDVAEFENAVRAATKANGATERVQRLSGALDAYAGRLLPAYYEEWITGEQERLSSLFFDALGRLLPLLEASGDLDAAVAIARKAIAVEPLREEGHSHLIRLLAASGQPGAALRQFKEWERRLDEELADEPSAPLRALARQIEKQSGMNAPAVTIRVTRPPTPALTQAATAGMPATLTFLMSDIEGSTRQWERAGDAFRQALETHHALLRGEFARHGGRETKEAGDSFLVAFGSARKALDCAVAGQQALAGQAWPHEVGPIRVRMALHTGDVEQSADGEYHGLVLHRASRMLTAAHGGQILVSEVTAGLVRRELGDEVRLTDLGIYRLRDVPTPERLLQVEYPGMTENGFAPLAAEAGYQANLPLQFTRFFGREREIAELTALLQSSQTRLVTLSGPGGTGKTRLALQVAERLTQPLGGAVWFAPLADIADPSLIVDTILGSLRVPRSPQREPLDQAVEALAKQPCLLVLDNFEHLVENGTVTVQALLARVPNLTVLVTSRQLLGLSGEREFALKPLPTPNGVADTPERLSAYDGVRLFIDRAQTSRPDFQITNANAPTVAELCDRLEGIPLALELAAARAQVLTPTQMLAQLAHRFDFLSSRKRDVTDRQRTLRGAIDWSYRLLAPELQRFFARLSVFRGGWTVEAAEAVCEEPLALDYLAQLRECSLALTEEGDGMRFSLLETLREYAHEQLVSEERAAAERRHVDFFVVLAEDADSQRVALGTQRYLDTIEAESDNLRAALGYCRHETGTENGLRLVTAMGMFWICRCYFAEGGTWCGDVMSRPSAAGRTAARARALHVWSGYTTEPQRFLEESLEIWREVGGNARHIANVLCSLGFLARDTGDPEGARAYMEQSLTLYRELEAHADVERMLTMLGFNAWGRRDTTAARALFEESFALAQSRGAPENSLTLWGLGSFTAFELGDLATGRALLERSLSMYRELRMPEFVAYVLEALGGIAIQEGDFPAAHSLLVESLTIMSDIEHRHRTTVMPLGRFVAIAEAQGRMERAARLQGFMDTLWRNWTPDAEFEARLARVRESLGQGAFEAAFQEGRAMAWEQGVAYAMEDAA